MIAAVEAILDVIMIRNLIYIYISFEIMISERNNIRQTFIEIYYKCTLTYAVKILVYARGN